ncbi:MAG: hypothetical protein AAGK32_05080, partial [Actinomycetota bacterium]
MRTTTPETAGDPGGDQRLLTPSFVLLTVAGFFALAGFASTLPLVPRYVDGVLGGSKVEIGLALGMFSTPLVTQPADQRPGENRRDREHPQGQPDLHLRPTEHPVDIAGSTIHHRVG